MDDNHPKSTLDVSGLLCPLPVLRARKALLALAPGAVLKVIATDPMAMIDMPHFCQEQGHGLIEAREDKGSYHFLISRAKDPA